MKSSQPKAKGFEQVGNSCAACTLAMVLHETGIEQTPTGVAWSALYLKIWNQIRFYSGDKIGKITPPGGKDSYHGLQNTNPYRLVREARRRGLNARLCLSSRSRANITSDLKSIIGQLESEFEGGGDKHRRTKDVNLEDQEGLDLISKPGYSHNYASVVCTMIESSGPTGMHNVLVKHGSGGFEVYDSNLATRTWTPAPGLTGGSGYGTPIPTLCKYGLVYLGLSVVIQK